MIRSNKFTSSSIAQTITVVNGQIIPYAVTAESIAQTNDRLKNSRFMLLYNDEEIIVCAKVLQRILSPEAFSAVLATNGNVAIVDNRLIAII